VPVRSSGVLAGRPGTEGPPCAARYTGRSVQYRSGVAGLGGYLRVPEGARRRIRGRPPAALKSTEHRLEPGYKSTVAGTVRLGAYEEYHPYGSTAWWAQNSGTEVSRKRYRYTGMERDEETSLSRHGVRMYATWLGRWASADPSGLKAGVNRFRYCSGNPIGSVDTSGMADFPLKYGPQLQARTLPGGVPQALAVQVGAAIANAHAPLWQQDLQYYADHPDYDPRIDATLPNGAEVHGVRQSVVTQLREEQNAQAGFNQYVGSSNLGGPIAGSLTRLGGGSDYDVGQSVGSGGAVGALALSAALAVPGGPAPTRSEPAAIGESPQISTGPEFTEPSATSLRVSTRSSPPEGPVPGATPRGFAIFPDFGAFGTTLKQGLAEAGFAGTRAFFQGSSVTGVQYASPNDPFDIGRLSDFDVALAGADIFAQAKSLGIPLRQGGSRTGPLLQDNLRALGLYDLQQQLTRDAGRDVNFMIYRDPAAAASRSPSVEVP
jgi:RHS repeat-associated protein